MEYMGEDYFKMKATVIKFERFLLKVNIHACIMHHCTCSVPLTLVHVDTHVECCFDVVHVRCRLSASGTGFLCSCEAPSQGM